MSKFKMKFKTWIFEIFDFYYSLKPKLKVDNNKYDNDQGN